jgi:hypothetical protein
MTSLPRDEQNAEYWRPAATILAIIDEKGGCMSFAERAVAFGLRKGKLTPKELKRNDRSVCAIIPRRSPQTHNSSA